SDALELIVEATSPLPPQPWASSFFDRVQLDDGEGRLRLIRSLPGPAPQEESQLELLRTLVATRSREELMAELRATNRRREGHQAPPEATHPRPAGRVARGEGAARRRQSGEKRLLGDDEPRDPHADERHHQHDRPGSGNGAIAPTAAVSHGGPLQRPQ